jgi:hypothetical protein
MYANTTAGELCLIKEIYGSHTLRLILLITEKEDLDFFKYPLIRVDIKFKTLFNFCTSVLFRCLIVYLFYPAKSKRNMETLE